MDISLLVEVHQYYIKALRDKKTEDDKQRTPPTIVMQAVQTVQAKSITVYLSQLSCIANAVVIFNDTETNITHLTKSTKQQGSITYTFPNEQSVHRVIINRPDCTTMTGCYVCIKDNTNTTTYESIPIVNTQDMQRVYTFTIPHRTTVQT